MLKVGSHFSGIGAANEAIKKYNLPFEVIYSIEYEKTTQEAYKSVFNTKNIYGDISKVKPEELPKVDLIITSPPCQAFSNAGNKKSFEDDRGKILLETFRIIEFQKPLIVLFENVENLTTIDNGEVFKLIKSLFQIMGYKVYSKLLNSINYNSAQNRNRIFIVAIDQNQKTPFYFSRKQKLKETVKKILCSDPRDIKIKEDIEIKKLFPIKSNKLKQSHEIINCSFDTAARVYRPYTSPTLTCSSDIFFNIDNSFRTLTFKERFKLQGFTDDTINKYLSLNLAKTVYLRFTGNTININVMGALLKQINKTFEKMENKTHSIKPTQNLIYSYGLQYITTHFLKASNRLNFDLNTDLRERQRQGAFFTHNTIKNKNKALIKIIVNSLLTQNIKLTQYKIIKYSNLSKNTVKKYKALFSSF